MTNTAETANAVSEAAAAAEIETSGIATPKRKPARPPKKDAAKKSTSKKDRAKKAKGKKAGRKTDGAKSAKGKKKDKKGKKKTKVPADKFVLYQESVQNSEFEVRFFQRAYRKFRGTTPSVLREDFCGTALVCAEWVKRLPEGRAIGVDLDRPTLDWGRTHNIEPIGDDAARVELVCADVRDGDKRDVRPDVVAALNFSYCCMKRRADLRDYFASVYRSLDDDGIFVLDCYGGPEAQQPQVEITEYDGFDYEWDQDSFNPITAEATCYIHFKVKGGPRLEKAFRYDWRVWTMPELTDLLEEVGFQRTDVYWEGTDKKTGEGNGVFRISTKGDDSDAWIAYVAAAKR